MSEQVSRKLPSRHLSRRSVLQSSAALLSAPFIAKATAAFGQEKLAGTGEVVVCSAGGPFKENFRKYVSDPFTKVTGIRVVDVTADDAEPQIKAMRGAGRVDWDVAPVNALWPAYSQLSHAGAFVPIDYSLWDDEALKGVPEYGRNTHAVLAYSSTSLLVYDERVFRKVAPKSWADFWNVKEFPGPRGLGANSYLSDLVFALSADGFTHKGLWRLTDDMVDRALKKLDEIKPQITKWWTAGGETIPLVVNGEYAMTSSFDGRALTAIKSGAPIRMVWDGACATDNYWTVLEGGPNSANAQKFIAFLNRAEIAANFTQWTGYSGPNLNQLKYLPAELVPLLSITPENAAKIVRFDAPWFLEKRSDGKSNAEHTQERFLAWRAK
ncbi:putative spermidine/putrescine transport system substrate-binding protein/mannopine transport system substrate-binding protein [Bradyrhizobium brasilense]|uniref:Putative spermidine/putrescine transport system substrate-binding protein/mannopine transport system substrate-binding protein n=1 Tax=Bradyrhizobium brasilense TaxID=1419277 RepID=A0A1G6U4M0_9BRAD|nr:ABC transporter substrate-binding protein [Bradyrhizobium brasilense]SDD36298.1 putative spermidine/putrescine transport system substrate-binding protein/mannopine transport system substrate-binding protein [Bradyrhizobium brasilense]